MNATTKRAKEIFLEAVRRITPERWDAHVAQACGGDDELRGHVKHLLEAHVEAGSFLESPAPGLAVTVAQPEITEAPGTVIGPYKLLQEIGEGGMGTVFMAEQTHPVQRKVALKIIKPGMDSRQVIAQFEAERQALALMDHPNIAKVLDAGTTDTVRPYFVMELVKGIPITKYCDDNHLTPRERLELFIPVCHAVQHAHQKGIIHRDIKPSNVLVALYDGRPVPKVIDFGVAKATSQKLTERTMFTQFGQIVGTLEYMSPEQADLNQLDIDTRSDIYSLGVLLYELLTGTTPFERKRLREAAFDELLRIIREEEPPKPSTRLSTTDELPSIAASRKTEPRKLSGLVRGELDWIVMKALEKDRSRRYETANGFAMDVQRYLADEPVQACPPSAVCRFGKFARRNQVPLAMAGLILLILVTLAGSVGWFAGDRAARWTAVERQVDLALQEATQLMQQAKWPEARAWLERADGLLAGGGSRDEVRRRVSALRNDLDLVQRLEEVRLEKAAVLDGGMTYAEVDTRYAQVFRDYGIDLDELGVDEAAERIAQSAVCSELTAMIDDWVIVRRRARGPNDVSWKKLLAVARAADPNELRGRLRVALERGDRGLLRELAGSDDVARLSPPTVVFLAGALASFGEHEQAVSTLRRAIRTHPGDFWINYELATQLHEAQPPRLEEIVQFSRVTVALRPQSAAAVRLFGDTLRHNGAFEEAIAQLREAIRLKPEYSAAHNHLGLALYDKGALDDAIAEYHEAIRLKPGDADFHSNLGVALATKGVFDDAIAESREAVRRKPDDAELHHNLGTVLRQMGALDKAIAEYREAIRLKPDEAKFHKNLGGALIQKGALDEAVAECREAIRQKPDDASSHMNLGIALKEKGALDEAFAEYREAIRLKPDDAQAHYNLGIALIQKGDLDGAIAEYRAAIRLNPHDALSHYNLGNALTQKGAVDEAIAEYREAIRLKPGYPDAHVNLGNGLADKDAFNEAIAAYREAIRLKSDHTIAHVNLGEALKRKGKFREALTAKRRGHELGSMDPNWRYPSAQWVAEAERLVELDDKLAAVLSGEANPGAAAEQIEFAWLCLYYKHQNVAAVRFYADAFAAQPELAADLTKQHRYNAACAAALTGCGKGEDAGSIGDEERARLRLQALDWLRADLESWRKLLEGDSADARATVVKTLKHWQSDSDLVGVRDAEALAKLPEAEREAWGKLWAEVAELLGSRD